MGSVDNHEGVVIRDKNIADVPFKITGKFILGGLATSFRFFNEKIRIKKYY